MKLRRLLFAILLLGMCTAVAHAGVFVGASIGQAGIKDTESGLNFDESDTGYKVFGGFTFMKFFSVEGSYLNFGSPSGSAGGGVDLKVKPDGWDVMGVGTLPIGKHFEIFGKLGYFFWSYDGDFSGGGGSVSDSGSDLMYGGGVAFKFMKRLAVRLEYEKFDIKDIDTTDMASAGIVFNF